MSLARILSLDHLVLTVHSIPRTIKFYQRLGMTHEPFQTATETRHALKFGEAKLNLHEVGREFEPKAKVARGGTADLCFVVAEPVEEVLGRLKALNGEGEGEGVEFEEGAKVVERTGARGKIRSVYIRDPDGNLIELSNYK